MRKKKQNPYMLLRSTTAIDAKNRLLATSLKKHKRKEERIG